MGEHIETFPALAFKVGKLAGGAGDANTPVVIHCLDATYPITDVHMMHDGSIGIEIAMHETGEECNCGPATTRVIPPRGRADAGEADE